ncbi:cytosolic sulfotransferase 5-like isoform X2 [Coffea eugenioides]|uniref:cytosolic sulfotransferase 5-like isoform X2 n=1 Tax=Coffea eugenioides TaxID=49369 RepID=UPI000F60593A|nr:cytosolic sulfotransferase 5-like isoform X2 [Coffea eugenioides]
MESQGVNQTDEFKNQITSSTLSPCHAKDELPKVEKWWGFADLYEYDGFWYRIDWLEGAIAAKSNFQAQDNDFLLSSPPKSGTTWLKSLMVSIMDGHAAQTFNNINDAKDQYDLLEENFPHNLIPCLEMEIFNPLRASENPDLKAQPRLYQTHVPYSMLSESVKNSGCKIVYIARDPKDVLVSLWYFVNAAKKPEEEPYPMEDAFDSFCKGVHLFGPFHDHVLGYWKESLARPDKILFLRYEDMKMNPRGEVTKLASFLGRPFINDDEVDRIISRCSLERLKGMHVNKEGRADSGLPKSSFFRRGVVGDWKNHLTPEMKERLDEIAGKKFQGAGLDIYYP